MRLCTWGNFQNFTTEHYWDSVAFNSRACLKLLKKRSLVGSHLSWPILSAHWCFTSVVLVSPLVEKVAPYNTFLFSKGPWIHSATVYLDRVREFLVYLYCVIFMVSNWIVRKLLINVDASSHVTFVQWSSRFHALLFSSNCKRLRLSCLTANLLGCVNSQQGVQNFWGFRREVVT